jgi:hypothetical protein
MSRPIHLLIAAALALGCARGRWRSLPAEHPLTRSEVGAWNVTVAERVDAPDAELAALGRSLRDALAEAMRRRGFKVVDHPPYHRNLEVAVHLEREGHGPGVFAAAHLRSDGFYVADAEERQTVQDLRDPSRVRELAGMLADSLAKSDGLAFFVRNSGVAAQVPVMN